MNKVIKLLLPFFILSFIGFSSATNAACKDQTLPREIIRITGNLVASIITGVHSGTFFTEKDLRANMIGLGYLCSSIVLANNVLTTMHETCPADYSLESHAFLGIATCCSTLLSYYGRFTKLHDRSYHEERTRVITFIRSQPILQNRFNELPLEEQIEMIRNYTVLLRRENRNHINER